MGTLIVEGVLLGMILGRFFKWPVLAPACGLAIVLVLANPAQMDSFPQIVMVIASLQFGYVVGVVTRSLRRAAKRSKDLGVRSFDATPSSSPKTCRSSRTAV
jgi:hypothetical protein